MNLLKDITKLPRIYVMPTELILPDRLILFDKYDMDDKWKMHGNMYYEESRSFGSIWMTWKEYDKFIQLK